MSARPIDMHRLQEAVRLHRLGRSQRRIAELLRMGRPSLRRYFGALTEAALLDGPADEVPAALELRKALEAHLERKRAPQQASSLESWRTIIEEKREAGASPTAIFDYLRLHVEGFAGSLSATKRLCRALDRERGILPADVVVPVTTAPGEVAQVDFVYAGLLYDPASKVMRKAWIFLMTLGHSRFTFAEIVFDQKTDTWLQLHIHAFEWFGGVPRVIVPDNLKAAVIRASFGVDDDAVLSRSYRELARAYGFVIDPTPPRSPEKKGKVERDAKYVRNNFLATLSDVDAPEAQRLLRDWLVKVAGQRIHGTTRRKPLEVFEEEEKAALLTLPPRRWSPVIWRQVSVHRDCHVQIDGAFYSVPWKFVGMRVWARCRRGSIAIYHEDALIQHHSRVARGTRSTVDSHLPEGRADLRHRSKEYWLGRAAAMGKHVEELVQRVFDADDVLLQLRRAQQIVRVLEQHPPERAERTAKRALHYGALEYRAIRDILRKGLDLQPLDDEVEPRRWSTGARFARGPQSTLFLDIPDKPEHDGKH